MKTADTVSPHNTQAENEAVVDRWERLGLVKRNHAAPAEDISGRALKCGGTRSWHTYVDGVCKFCGHAGDMVCQGKFLRHKFNLLTQECERCGSKPASKQTLERMKYRLKVRGGLPAEHAEHTEGGQSLLIRLRTEATARQASSPTRK